jgi:ABC-type nickel/cobalt efflux system permease component RcnA
MSDPQPPAPNPNPAAPEGAGPDTAPPVDVVPHAGIRYAVLRLGMLVTVGGVLYVIGLRSWLLLFAAVLLSGIASWFVFMRQREAAARNLEASVEHWNAKRHSSEHESAEAPWSGDQQSTTGERNPAES